jgi:methionyl-tRNA synthetase
MQQRYVAGEVQPRAPEAVDEALRAAFAQARREVDEHVPAFALHRALEAIWRALDHANKYVTETAPFSLAKDPVRRPRVGAILHELCETLRTTAQLVAPFLPETAERLAGLLGLPADVLGRLDLPWGQAFVPGHRTRPPEVLFPRIEALPS